MSGSYLFKDRDIVPQLRDAATQLRVPIVDLLRRVLHASLTEEGLNTLYPFMSGQVRLTR